jgi:putative toxin-antitoxin system antitoxin component (TIGR02293 family)
MEKVRPTTSKSSAEMLAAGSVELRTRLNANTESEAEQQYLAYNTVVGRAVDVFGSELKATRWLSRPSQDFDGKSPLDALVDADFDPTPILDTLGKIEHGVYF